MKKQQGSMVRYLTPKFVSCCPRKSDLGGDRFGHTDYRSTFTCDAYDPAQVRTFRDTRWAADPSPLKNSYTLRRAIAVNIQAFFWQRQ